MATSELLTGPNRRARGPSRRPRAHRGPLRLLIAATVLLGGLAALVAFIVTRPSGASRPPGCTVASSTGPYTLTLEQAQNAAIIAGVAYKLGLPDHAVTVALAAAMQETDLRNLPYGDRDSVGLFQQRPSQGWGTTAQLLDPVYATTAFYGALAKVSGWQSMAVTDAAQAVQQSAAPSAYAAWDSEARATAVALTGEQPAALSCRFSSYGGAAPPATALGSALTTEMGSNLLGSPVPTATGWRLAGWVVAHAFNYHVSSVSFAGQTWQAKSGRWTHGSGSASPTVVGVTTG
jgi:hypothetical protein